MFARPMTSKTAPLRTALLDDKTNNIPPSRTRTELLRLRRRCNEADLSFDIDGDGDVSQQDYVLAKKYDANGNGLLEPAEQSHARECIARDFFNDHQHDVHLYGTQWHRSDMKANAHRLATADNFAVTFRMLKRRERRLCQSGSAHVRRVLTTVNSDKFHFYCDKFDTTAWNDYDAHPRQLVNAQDAALSTVNGSRLSLFQRRFIQNREQCAHALAAADAKRPKFTTLRTSLISNIAVENL